MLTIRKNGGASVVSLPRAVLKALGVDNGSQLEYTISGSTLILKPLAKDKELTCADLLGEIGDLEYYLPELDRGFLDDSPRGNEKF